MKRAAAIATAGGLALLATPSLAHQAEDRAETPRPATQVSNISGEANPALPDRFGLFTGEHLQISTGTDDDNLTLRFALPTGAAMEHRFALTASTPLHGDDRALPASLDALANGTRVTLSWGYTRLPIFDPDPVAVEIGDAAVRECQRKEPQERRCTQQNYAVTHHIPERYFEYRAHSIPAVWDFGANATVGINDFEWVDPTTLAPRTDRRTDWSVAGYFTRYSAGSMTAITGSLSYQRAYEAVDEQLLCPPNAVDPATQCITARGAAPRRNENFLVSLELRHRFVSNGRVLPLAVAPMVTYDVEDDIWGVDVPIYYVPDENGRLNGGLRISYRSDREDKFSIGVFVGTTFNMLNGGS